jgi:Cu/Ag efflux protein CusF
VASRTSTSQATEKVEVRRVRGEVTAVEPSANPMTLTMKTKEGKEELTVGVDVTDKTIIREGKARKTLSDIKVGDRLWMKYERTDGKLVADYVRILKPTHVAARSASSKASY